MDDYETLNINETFNYVGMKTTSISPDTDSDEHKKVNVTYHFVNVPFGSIIDDAIRTDTIRLQRDLRKNFDNLIDGQTMDRTYHAKPSTVVSVAMGENVIVNNMIDMTDAEKDVYVKELLERSAKHHGTVETATPTIDNGELPTVEDIE